ncbi:A disintegrin and metalloproteinase with thrombospondin motifs 9-like [Crassostrea virginica]
MKKSTASTTTTETLQEISTQLITYCTNSCLENPFCVATIFSRNMGKCLLQRRSSSGIPMTVETNSELYEVQFDSSFRKKYPTSCSEVKKCSPFSAEGEYWLYPEKFDGQVPVKTYCHMMTSSETAEEYITLKYANHFVKKDFAHLINGEWCSRNSQPLMITYFDRIRVNITSMGVVQDDFTFATTTGVSSFTDVPFGTAHDCTAESWWEKIYGPCTLESEFSINLRDSGVAIEDSVEWVAGGYASDIRHFYRSPDSTQVDCLVIAWCGKCVPNGPIYLKSQYDTADDTAQLITCQ